MPLRDHFHPPLSKFASWEGFHGGWPMVIVQHIVKKLPNRYVAEPRVHLGSQIEVDVATLAHGRSEAREYQPDTSGVATVAWAPAADVGG